MTPAVSGNAYGNRPTVVISRCLLGQRTRYNGGSKFVAHIVHHLARYCTLLPVCPEVECGMPTPREPMELAGSCLWTRVRGVYSGQDYSARLLPWCAWAAERLQYAHGFVLKANSPSCACHTPKPVWSDVQWPAGTPLPLDGSASAGRSLGVFARAMRGAAPDAPMADELGLVQTAQRDDFLQRVMSYYTQRAECCLI